MRARSWRRFIMAVLAMIMPVARAHAERLSDADLHRYGFGERMVHTLKDADVHEPPRAAREAAIPPPIVGAAPLPDRDIPEPTVGPTRLIPQGGRGEVPPYEGPTRVYQGSDGKELEGTFREVENFFFRPGRHYDRFLSQSERDVTGLVSMYTGEIDRKSSTHGRFGVQHTLFRKSFGQGLLHDRRLEQILFPVVAMVVPGKDLEIAQSLTVVDEQARNHPLIRDFSVTGLRDATTTVKYRFLDNPEDRVSMAGLFAIRVGIENVVTRIGSNGVDFLMGMALTKRIHNLGLHLDGGYIFANGQDRSNNRAPDVGFADFGIDFQTGPRLDWTLEVGYTDFDFVGHRLEITPGVKWAFAERWRFDVGFPLTADDTVAAGYHYRLTSGFQFRF